MPNTAAVVRAFRSLWSGTEGFALVANFSQPTVHITPGDVVAAAVESVEDPGFPGAETHEDPKPSPAIQSIDGHVMAPPQIAHVCVDRKSLNYMMSVELPPERYYDALAQDMRLRHPKASRAMLEHCAVVEACLLYTSPSPRDRG